MSSATPDRHQPGLGAWDFRRVTIIALVIYMVGVLAMRWARALPAARS